MKRFARVPLTEVYDRADLISQETGDINLLAALMIMVKVEQKRAILEERRKLEFCQNFARGQDDALVVSESSRCNTDCSLYRELSS